eukprot:TRINITY_DN4229_c0_g1_i1.p1 TRINITY_DN4229_c0_g1~~TRINITY_DN4229_c0_g1_i1.p1  ORF type:complete len:448 (-),score=124.09 TRINITY_DN4229_c0_g1_i1:1379-2722(-)
MFTSRSRPRTPSLNDRLYDAKQQELDLYRLRAEVRAKEDSATHNHLLQQEKEKFSEQVNLIRAEQLQQKQDFALESKKLNSKYRADVAAFNLTMQQEKEKFAADVAAIRAEQALQKRLFAQESDRLRAKYLDDVESNRLHAELQAKDALSAYNDNLQREKEKHEVELAAIRSEQAQQQREFEQHCAQLSSQYRTDLETFRIRSEEKAKLDESLMQQERNQFAVALAAVRAQQEEQQAHFAQQLETMRTQYADDLESNLIRMEAETKAELAERAEIMQRERERLAAEMAQAKAEQVLRHAVVMVSNSCTQEPEQLQAKHCEDVRLQTIAEAELAESTPLMQRQGEQFADETADVSAQQVQLQLESIQEPETLLVRHDSFLEANLSGMEAAVCNDAAVQERERFAAEIEGITARITKLLRDRDAEIETLRSQLAEAQAALSEVVSIVEE